jgi:methionyl-tRNA synthetase
MVINFSFNANKYFNDLQTWALKKTDPSRMNTILYVISIQIKNISILLNPIIPKATNKIFDLLNIPKTSRNLDSINTFSFNHEKELGEVNILFKKVENDN